MKPDAMPGTVMIDGVQVGDLFKAYEAAQAAGDR
jgi:hypothetical protein